MDWPEPEADWVLEKPTRYWHIAHPTWVPGDDPLMSRDQLEEECGHHIPWKWGDDAPEGTDTHLVCLFPDTPRGRQEAQWMHEDYPDHHVVRVDLPEGHEMTCAEWEPYPAVHGEIAAEYLTKVDQVPLS